MQIIIITVCVLIAGFGIYAEIGRKIYLKRAKENLKQLRLGYVDEYDFGYEIALDSLKEILKVSTITLEELETTEDEIKKFGDEIKNFVKKTK